MPRRDDEGRAKLREQTRLRRANPRPDTAPWFRAKLREEKERRLRADERNKWLSGEFAKSQQVALGLTVQIEQMRATSIGERFRAIWAAASTEQRDEMRKLMQTGVKQ